MTRKFLAQVKFFHYDDEDEHFGWHQAFPGVGYMPHLQLTNTSKNVKPFGVRFLGPIDFEYKDVEFELIDSDVDLMRDSCFEILEGKTTVGFGVIILELGK